MLHSADKELKKSFVLPFATPAADRLKDFTKDMEMAAVLYLAESNREKGGSRILWKPDEKLAFITEAWYPIWLVPFDGSTLMFDGLGITSHTISYDAVPDAEIFKKDIEESKKTTEAYTATLFRNADYFKDFTGKEERTIEGLIGTSNLIEDFEAYFLQMKETQKPVATKAFLPLLVEDDEIQASLDQLTNLRKEIDGDIENIDTSMRLLNATTAERTKAIREEIKKTQEEDNRHIEKIKPNVTRKILQIQNKYHRKITRASKRFKIRLQRLSKNQTRLQKTLRHLKIEAKNCETRIKSNRRRKKRQKETRCRLKLKRIKKKAQTLSKEIKRTTEKIREIEAAQKFESVQLKAECNVAIEAAQKPLQVLEASKEAETTMKRQEIAPLEDATSRITSQMRKIAEAKNVIRAKFDTITMSRRRQTSALVYVPFYLVRYEKEDQKRYTVYPPSIVSDLGILTKMKGALGATKMKALLQPRSDDIAAFLNQFEALIERKPMLEKEVTEAGIQGSILLAKQLRISVKKGLKELEKENWMSKNELQTFSKLLYIYA